MDLDLEPAAGARQIDAYWAGAEADHAARRELACYLVDRLNGKRSVMYEVSVREVPARSLLSLLRYVHHEEFPAVARDFFGRFASGSVPRLAGIGGTRSSPNSLAGTPPRWRSRGRSRRGCDP